MMDLARGLLIVVMAIAALGKLRAPGELVPVMRAMGVPLAMRTTVILLGLVELGAVALLATSPALGCAVTLVLLVGFTLGLVSAIRRRATIACHCFGASAAPIGPSHLVRNAVLIAAALAGLAGTGRGVENLVIGAVIGGAITAWDELTFLFQPSTRATRNPERTTS